ncbi:hypothetical protein [Kitasatospora sp. NPDC056181]|uniref:hypothetical protein n=1 Tax=Kitasatospora sp. NPDC056181 TaxID=3345737 RepID=UPI0035D7C55A
MALSKRLGWAALLLALAFPAAAGSVLAVLAAVASFLLAHPTVACVVGAGLLLASTLPALRRRVARARVRRQLRGLSAFRLKVVGDH